MGFLRLIIACLLLVGLSPLGAQPGTPPSPPDRAIDLFRSLDGKVSALKEKALELNRDLTLIEEESFIQGSAQLIIFFGLEKKTPPQHRNIQVRLELDGDLVANHAYADRELDALHRNGRHRLYLGSLTVGKHRLVAKFTGTGGNGGKNFETRTSIEFTKGWERKHIEVMMSIPEKNDTPKVSANERNS